MVKNARDDPERDLSIPMRPMREVCNGRRRSRLLRNGVVGQRPGSADGPWNLLQQASVRRLSSVRFDGASDVNPLAFLFHLAQASPSAAIVFVCGIVFVFVVTP